MSSIIEVGSVWRDDSVEVNVVTVTAVDGDIIEYCSPGTSEVYYLRYGSFKLNFVRVTDGSVLNKEALLVNLTGTLIELKGLGYGDQVYAMLDDMGL